jgi:ketosteroid isomerase-like protein
MAYVMSDSQKPAELFRRSLDAFLAKDMRAWADLCAEDDLVEFPFAPAGTPSRLDGRVAIFEYLRNYPKIIDVHEIDSHAPIGVAYAERRRRELPSEL